VRIVSLLPSATEIVCQLGLSDCLVGVSADSDWPVEVVARLPVLNTVAMDTSRLTSRQIDEAAGEGHRGASLYHVDPQLLRTLQPDVVLTQEMCDVCAVTRRDVELAAATLGYTPRVLSLNPLGLEDMLDEVELVGRLAAAPDRGAALVAQLRARLASVAERTAGLARPRVFCMEWLDPPYTAGHWVPEMVELAGGRDELRTRRGASRRIDWTDVVHYAPDVIVLMPCSLELERVAAEFDVLRTLPDWDSLPAVRSRRVYAGDTNLFSRSGPRLVDGVEVIARLLHPGTFEQPLAPGQALAITANGQRLDPFR
jgi:iron complex transport system substrate-binding protein